MTTAGAFRPPFPVNEGVRSYAPGSGERASLQARLADMAAEQIDMPLVIAGRDVRNGRTVPAVMPHDTSHALGTVYWAGPAEVERAARAAGDAWHDWSRLPWTERAAVFLRAADLLAGPWRDTVNGATMLGQSKTVFQAEIDSACELIDFWRFNPYYARVLYQEQPWSSPGM